MKKMLFMMLLVAVGATSCKKGVCENPFFCDWETPFGVPPFDQIRLEHFKPAF